MAAKSKSALSAERLSVAVASLKPLLPGRPMVRVFLQNAGWSPAEIADHEAAVLKALAAELMKGEG